MPKPFNEYDDEFGADDYRGAGLLGALIVAAVVLAVVLVGAVVDGARPPTSTSVERGAR